MGHLTTVAACSLNQWALDWECNTNRIIESIKLAKKAGAKLRVGGELEITGYDCLDHFLENETYLLSWEMLARILDDKECYGCLLDIGAPVMHRNLRLNCRILALDGKILLIRPKLWLANDGNYREMRYFTPWREGLCEDFILPRSMQPRQGAVRVPIGDMILSTADTCIGAETCEELFTPDGPHIHMGLQGVEIFTNSSASHHELRKLDKRLALILEATRKSGGIYIYANLKGGGGDRLYYDGSSMIVCNGIVKAQGSQFSLDDIEVVTATVDLEEVRAYRCSASRGLQAVRSTRQYRRIDVTAYSMSLQNDDFKAKLTPSCPIKIHAPEEEIALGPALWLWDYLRRSSLAGFLLPLSGGVDSCATAVIVSSLSRLLIDAIRDGNPQVISDVQRIAGAYEKEGWLPQSTQALTRNLFHTLYLGMASQSSKETRSRAKELSKAIGSYHTDLNIDDVFNAQKNIFTKSTRFEPRFKVHGGSIAENLALQNIQARTRMVTAYEFSQLLPTIRGRKGGGSCLVLGSANVDEALRGYYTRYDCSSADLNPIGGISKTDLKKFIAWACTNFDLPILKDFLAATPTAELEPLEGGYVQSDEADMGLLYSDLQVMGSLRKIEKMGPFSMFQRLVREWTLDKGMTPREVATKVKRFFHYYAVNRHKMSTLTPSYHAESYGPDDHRHDHRFLVYPPLYDSLPAKKIDAAVEKMEAEQI
ncbi:hypothetical protein JMJ35_001513 [Cladonia borealis]|uniref:Glutamine-dependent NAD(+) synthetase n=1 Tax=Cladonia borealis TaxID=184061 RepID=A0AA39R869_9LECA|nr:hypothetical protein JMJ35_001513 [Cladonia borealis]